MVRVLVRRRSSGSAGSAGSTAGDVVGTAASEEDPRRVRCRGGRSAGPWSRPVISVVGSVAATSAEVGPTAIFGDAGSPAVAGFLALLLAVLLVPVDVEGFEAFDLEVEVEAFSVDFVDLEAPVEDVRRAASVLVRGDPLSEPLLAESVDWRGDGDPGRLGPLVAGCSFDAEVRVARPFVTSGPVSPGRSGTYGSLRDGLHQPPKALATGPELGRLGGAGHGPWRTGHAVPR